MWHQLLAVEISPTAVIAGVAAVLTIAASAGLVAGTLLRSTKNEIIADQEKRIALLKDERGDCDAKVAELSGRLAVLEGDFVERIAMAVANAVLIRVEQQPAPQRRRKAAGE